MSYLAAASKNANKLAPAHTFTRPAPSPAQAPKPTPPPQPEPEEEEAVFEPQEEREVEEVEEPEEEVEVGEVEIGGDDDTITGGGVIRNAFDEENVAQLIVLFMTPESLSALARTCKYFYRAVFTSPSLWSFVTGLPEPLALSVRFFIDVSNAEEGQKENIQSIPISQLKSEYQKNQLVKFWLRTVSSAYSNREAEKAKSQDPTEKRELKAVLKGGFSFGSGQNEKPILKVNNLAQIPHWLNALIVLIRKTEKSVTLPLDDGSVSLTRIGRGGHLISVTVKSGKEKENAIYDFGDFSEQIRENAENYFKIVGACRTKLKKPQQVNQPNAFPEIEKFINEVLAHDRLNNALPTIEKLLKSGAIPHSTLPEYFKRKEEEKRIRKNQETSEAGSILNFLRKNLPQTLEEAKKARDVLDKRIKQQIESDFWDRERAFLEKIRLQNEQRKAESDAAKSGKGSKTDNAEKESPKEQKTPYKLIKQTDKDGFERLVKVDESGNVLKEVKNDKNKKDKKDKLAKVAKEAKKAAAVKVDASSPTSNPFAAVENADDAGAEIKEKKQQQQQQHQPQKQAEPQKGKENQKKQPESKKEEKKAAEPVEKSKKPEQKKPEEKPKAEEKAKSEKKQLDTPKKETKETKKTEKKQEDKSNKKESSSSNKKGQSKNKGKSEEDKAQKPKQATAVAQLQQQFTTPAIAVALLVLAVLALYTVFLS